MRQGVGCRIPRCRIKNLALERRLRPKLNAATALLPVCRFRFDSSVNADVPALAELGAPLRLRSVCLRIASEPLRPFAANPSSRQFTLTAAQGPVRNAEARANHGGRHRLALLADPLRDPIRLGPRLDRSRSRDDGQA